MMTTFQAEVSHSGAECVLPRATHRLQQGVPDIRGLSLVPDTLQLYGTDLNVHEHRAISCIRCHLYEIRSAFV